MEPTLKELNKASTDYLILHWDNGGTSEFDQSINTISREKVRAMKREYGSCFMYRINIYNDDEPIWAEYTGQKVYNFEFGIATPVFSQEIVDIIIKRHEKREGGYDYKRNMAEVHAIMDIVDKLNGINLIWT